MSDSITARAEAALEHLREAKRLMPLALGSQGFEDHITLREAATNEVAYAIVAVESLVAESQREASTVTDEMRYRGLQALRAYKKECSVPPTDLGIVATVLEAAINGEQP